MCFDGTVRLRLLQALVVAVAAGGRPSRLSPTTMFSLSISVAAVTVVTLRTWSVLPAQRFSASHFSGVEQANDDVDDHWSIRENSTEDATAGNGRSAPSTAVEPAAVQAVAL